MEYRKCKNYIVLRLDRGDEIAESIIRLAEKENITAASVSGIGATDCFTVGVFNSEKKEYEKFEFEGTHEINSLVGNISVMDGKPYVHLHITCTGKNCKVVGGHLLFAVVSLTAEIIVSVIPTTVSRKRDETEAINKWNFQA